MPDTVRPGRLRIPTRANEVQPDERFDRHIVRLRDLSAGGAGSPDFSSMGFDTLNLGPLEDLQETLETVRRASFITREDAVQSIVI